MGFLLIGQSLFTKVRTPMPLHQRKKKKVLHLSMLAQWAQTRGDLLRNVTMEPSATVLFAPTFVHNVAVCLNGPMSEFRIAQTTQKSGPLFLGQRVDAITSMVLEQKSMWLGNIVIRYLELAFVNPQ
mgnify:CR=1 FL=1